MKVLTACSAEADARSFYLRARGFDSRQVVQIRCGVVQWQDLRF